MAKKVEKDFNLSSIIKNMESKFGSVAIGSDCDIKEMVPFKNKTMNLITEGGVPFGHIHEFFGMSQTGKCVGGETIIYTDKGLMPIEDLFMPLLHPETIDKGDPKLRTIPTHTLLQGNSWYTLKEPLAILNFNGNIEHTNKLYYGGLQPTYVLYTSMGCHITGTPEHKLRAMHFPDGRDDEEYQDLELRQLDKLKLEEDVWRVSLRLGTRLYGNNLSLLKINNYPDILTPELAFTIGRFSISLSYSNYHGPKVVKVKRNIFDKEVEKWETQDITFYRRDPDFLKWLLVNEIIIASANTTEVPTCIRTAPREIVVAYLAGVLSCSSMQFQYNKWQQQMKFYHPSYHLINQVHTLLLNEGIPARRNLNTVLSRSEIIINKMNSGLLGSYLKKYAPKDEFWNEKLKEAPTEDAPMKPLMVWDSIQRIVKNNVPLPVYDLEMPKTHVYLAGGGIGSHNSFFMYELLGQAQKLYNPTFGLLIDREKSFFNKRVQSLGVDTSRVLIARPDTVNTPSKILDFIEYSIENITKGVPDAKFILIIDSIAAFEAGVARDKANMGKSAKNWHETFRAMMSLLSDNLMVLTSNHVTYNPGVVYGNNKTKTGGIAIDYYRTCGIGLDKIGGKNGLIVDPYRGNEVVGNYLRVIVDKTRLGPAHRTAIVPFYFTHGVDPLGGYLKLLADRNYIKASNSQKLKYGLQNKYTYESKGKVYAFTEGEEEKLITTFNELVFDTYPEYNFTGEPVIEAEEEGLEIDGDLT